MHTCAQHNPLPGTDIFGDAGEGAPQVFGVDLASGPDLTVHLLACVGTLARDAEVRVKPVGRQGDPAPVLCLDLQDVVPHASAVHVEQVFATADRAKAEAIAARLRKGMRISARCLMQDVRLSLTNAFGIEAQPVPHPHSHRKQP